MFRNPYRFPKHLAAAVAVVALAAPATSAALPRDAQDHRSADAVDAGLQERRQVPSVDHRSADAQDTKWVRSPEPLKIVESPGFDWGDASIGAGTLLGVLLITVSVMFTVVRRRDRAATT